MEVKLQGLEPVSLSVQSRLWLFGHVECKDYADLLKRSMKMKTKGTRQMEHPRNMWSDCVKGDKHAEFASVPRRCSVQQPLEAENQGKTNQIFLEHGHYSDVCVPVLRNCIHYGPMKSEVGNRLTQIHAKQNH